jgi:hypothetical protein
MLAALLLARLPPRHGVAKKPAPPRKKKSCITSTIRPCSRRHEQRQQPPHAAPDAKIVVVTHGKGIDFLLNDAKDEKGDPYASVVSGLKGKRRRFPRLQQYPDCDASWTPAQ